MEQTLVQALEAFEENPTKETALALRKLADQYMEDGMIGPSSWTHILNCIATKSF